MSVPRTRLSTGNGLAALVLLHRLTVQLDLVASSALPLGQTVPNVDIQVLTAVADEHDISPKRVAEATGRPRSTVSRSIARLTAAGLMERRRSAADGRSADLRLTSAGRSQVAGFAHALSEFFVSIEPTVKDYLVVVDRLPGSSGMTDESGTTDESDVLDLANTLAGAGSAYVAEVAPRLRPFTVDKFADRYALVAVAARGQVRPGELADEMGLSAPGVSTLVGRLEARGLLTRHSGVVPGDARSVIVQLTPRGSQAVRTSISVFRRHEPALSDALARTLSYRP